METTTVSSFTALVRAPAADALRPRWSAHCLDLDLGVYGQSAEEARVRLACSIANEIAAACREGRPLARTKLRRPASDPALWDRARDAPIVARQYIDTDDGLVSVCYVGDLA